MPWPPPVTMAVLPLELELLQIHCPTSVLLSRGASLSVHVLIGVAAVRVEAMDAGGIGRQRDLVAGVQVELADVARRERPERAGIDIEEGVAAEMLGDRHRSRPALAVAADLEMLGPDADGGRAVALRPPRRRRSSSSASR